MQKIKRILLTATITIEHNHLLCGYQVINYSNQLQSIVYQSAALALYVYENDRVDWLEVNKIDYKLMHQHVR